MKYDVVTPGMSLMVDTLRAQGLSFKSLARYCGVTQRTLARYVKTDQAPKSVRLSLFWITKYGESWLNSDLSYKADTYAGLARSLRDESALLEVVIDSLEQEVRRLSEQSRGRGVLAAANDLFISPFNIHRSDNEGDNGAAPTPPTTAAHGSHCKMAITELWEVKRST